MPASPTAFPVWMTRPLRADGKFGSRFWLTESRCNRRS